MSFKDKLQQQAEERQRVLNEKKKAEEEKARELGRIIKKQQIDLMLFTNEHILPLLNEVSSALYQKKQRIEIYFCGGSEFGKHISYFRIYLFSGKSKEITRTDSLTSEPFQSVAYESLELSLYADKLCVWHFDENLRNWKIKLCGDWKNKVEDALLRVIDSGKMCWDSPTHPAFVLVGEDELPFAERNNGYLDFQKSIETKSFVRR